jgi:hypothetical protein
MNQENRELIHFFNNVMIKLCIYDWTLNLIEHSSEGYCWKNTKIIDIGLKNENIKELILHEIAHIRTCRFCNQKHNPSFWKTFLDLMRRFLPNEELSNSCKQHMKYSTIGFYSLKYENGRIL